ncbi:prepilin peptidase [Enterobacter chuandaensis]
MAEILFASFIGAIVGSFLNVVAYRLPRILAGDALSLCWPHSHCPGCKLSIKVYHNIPIAGWLWLKGRCANCHNPIPLQYLLVEALTASLFAIVIAPHGLTPQSLADIVIVSLLIPLFIIDREHLLLPDRLTLPLLIVSLALAGMGYARVAFIDAFIAAVCGYSLPWLLDRYYRWRRGRTGMGMGDMKLFAGIGAWLGYDALLHIMLFASLSAIVITQILLHKKRSEAFPFGPYIIGAALAVFLLSPFLSF